MKNVFNHKLEFAEEVKSLIKECYGEFADMYSLKKDVLPSSFIVKYAPLGESSPQVCFEVFHGYSFHKGRYLLSRDVKDFLFKKEQERLFSTNGYAYITNADFYLADFALMGFMQSIYRNPNIEVYFYIWITPVLRYDDVILDINCDTCFTESSIPYKYECLEKPVRRLVLDYCFDVAFDFSEVSIYLDKQLRELNL